MSKERFQFDAAGWGFWGIVFAVLLGPSIWGAWHMMYQAQRSAVAVGAGLVVAALGAGVISWAVNAVLQRRQRVQRVAERKKAKKKQRG